VAWPDGLNPLARSITSDEARLALVQAQVRSVLDSYHGRLDAFAEALQNAVDALEARWSEWVPEETDDLSAEDARPRLTVALNFDENFVEVIDNGVGIAPAKVEELLEPFGSDKRGLGKRGHKGVGTTFLAYGHPKFELHTKHEFSDGPIAYAIEGGRAWATQPFGKIVPPTYKRISGIHPRLSKIESGTCVRIYFDGSTPIRDLSAILHNSPIMWGYVLRASTAIGRVSMGSVPTPKWIESIAISVAHRDGTEVVPFEFPWPHLSLKKGDSAELQWLQNNPGTTRQYKLVYARKSHAQLKVLLQDSLTQAENSDNPELVAIAKDFLKYEAGVYASLAYKNTFYEDAFRTQIKKPNAERLSIPYGVGGGVSVGSVSMPMSVLMSHRVETMQPQTRRRYFLLVDLNSNFSPDIGRKTVPQDVDRLSHGSRLKCSGLSASRLRDCNSTVTRPREGRRPQP
jgi:hypothetical protein